MPTASVLRAAGDNEAVSPRLPGGVVPRHYRIELDVDLDGAAFTGTVGIDIDISETVGAIVCNAADLDIAEAFITRSDSLSGGGEPAGPGGGRQGRPSSARSAATVSSIRSWSPTKRSTRCSAPSST